MGLSITSARYSPLRRALVQQTEDWAFRVDDVLGLRSDALLVRWTTSGTLRSSGGGFERLGHMLWTFGADGLATHWELFNPDREAEALDWAEATLGDVADETR